MKFLPVVLGALLLLASCQQRISTEDARLIANSKRVFGTIASVNLPPDPPALVALGKHLYFSNALSATRTQSCNTCHPVDGSKPGADGQPTSLGVHGTRGRRNAPTVLNASLHASQFWDGRAATLEEQASGPITNPGEMAMPDAKAVAERLRTDPSVDRARFKTAYPGDADPLTIEHAAKAIAAYERTLRTHDRFDDFQNGDSHALTPPEKAGLQRFMSIGCTSCHNGPALGATRFQRIGIVNPYDTPDHGRFELTKNENDDKVFKIPSLRNVALTAPYFHDGRIIDLPAAVERMAWHQLGMKIQPRERDEIVAFLRALSDPRLR